MLPVFNEFIQKYFLGGAKDRTIASIAEQFRTFTFSTTYFATGTSSDPKAIRDRNSLAMSQYLDKINKSARISALKNGHNFTPLTIPANHPLLTTGEVAGINLKITRKYPKISNGTDPQTIDELIESLKTDPATLSDEYIPAGWKKSTRHEAYLRHFNDPDMRGAIGDLLYRVYNKEYTAGSSSIDDVPKNSSNDPIPELVEMNMKIFGLASILEYPPQTGSGLSKTQVVFLMNEAGTASIQIHANILSGKYRPSMVDAATIKTVSEVLDRVQLPGTTGTITDVELVSSSSYSGDAGKSGTMAKANSATRRITVFTNRIDGAYYDYDTASDSNKVRIANQFSDPNAYSSRDALLEHAVAHEIGHMAAFIGWDPRKVDGANPWRVRQGMDQMEADLKPERRNSPISEYGRENADEYFAEAYAKYVNTGQATPEFRLILEKRGLLLSQDQDNIDTNKPLDTN